MDAVVASPTLHKPLPLELIRLARPKQWAKSVFVLIGPLSAFADHKGSMRQLAAAALIAAVILALCSSACYIVNDICDASKDRLHPRKRRRPIAAGTVTRSQAGWFAAALIVISISLLSLLGVEARWWVGGLALLYVINVNLYSLSFKRIVIVDVLSLSLGFVLRVLAGCGATSVTPSSWLLNCTFFLAMFLAFGKRLGERRTAGAAGVESVEIRGVHARYTDDILRITVAITAVATLITYSAYVQSREKTVMEWLANAGLRGGAWFNLLWLTMIPATYAMFRAILLLERGVYDDPTELVVRDRWMRLAVLLFGLITVAIVLLGQVNKGGGAGA